MKKLTVEIDLTDLYDEEEEGGTVSEMLTEAVRYSVIRTLSKEIHEKSFKVVSDKAISFIEGSKCVEKMTARIENQIDSGKIMVSDQYKNAEPLEAYIGRKMKDTLNSRHWTGVIDSSIKNAFTVLEKRYNDDFAIGILTKLKENNMLTDEAKNLLQSNSKPSSE